MSSSDSDSDSDTSVGDHRMQANALWAQMTRLPQPSRYAVTSESDSDSDTDASKDESLAGAHTNGLGLHNTAFKYHKRPACSVLAVDSLDRDPAVYPLPTSLRLKLPRVYRNIIQIDAVQVRFQNGIVPFSAARGNTTITVKVGGTSYTVTIPDGFYTAAALATAVQTRLIAVIGAGFTVGYTAAGFLTITYTGPFILQNLTGLASAFTGRTSDWGLGWNLGFGGLPTDVTSDGSNTVTATAGSRLSDEYVFLRLNESDQMNGIDHTGPENTAISQDSTGQVAHYFGKYMLNNDSGTWNCCPRRGIVMSRRFDPVLGRLDRLNVDWVDRWGQPLSGYTGAASCDWNMTLRITELVEGTAASSAVTFSQIGGIGDDFGMDQNPPYIR